MKILVAGASGALGRPLITRLHEAGHDVWGLASRPESLDAMTARGAHAINGNAMDRAGIFTILEQLRPDVVIDQLTSLPASPFDLANRLAADRHLRLEGGGNLFAAAQACQVTRYIQQSCGFYLDTNGPLATEASRLRTHAPGNIGESARMYAALEKRVLGSHSMQGVCLRYGFFYGPGTWYWTEGAFNTHLHNREVSLLGAGSSVFSFIHVDDAAQATMAALTAPAGVYNVVDNHPTPFHDWLAAYTRWVGAPAPARLSPQDALRLAGEESVYYQNNLTGANNHKARERLNLTPRPQPWLSAI
ncbi:NAD(P)-dependent oxidoreductase [Acetobacter suratthaniensis]|uniref:NAD(P)-dependent oxidoreductase n=1 Tax=Acetobacter suratthaniensis TaxID=1502841 RepID=A0ABS3LL78_9PROT|nr:NAD(P)-dependent oxidoreductase [Acetobacter suratthaniensis]MBO1328003.1 NAD(P)-dependent oxidoreductase [Acetobacter suratthaniensis]MCX2566159.1 NAD(P)-dependent oxidoreductase [Acetobacter suratthaniensis]